MELLRGPNKDNNNTVLFYEYFQTENEFCIVHELCDMSFKRLVLEKIENKEKKDKKEKKEIKEGFKVRDIYNILSQLNNSFRILKDNNLSHKDLRLETVLLQN